MKNGILIVKLEDDEGVDHYDKPKSLSTMPSHFGSFSLSHSKRMMNPVIRQIGGFKKAFNTLIPILCIYIRNTGLTWLILDL